MASFTQIHSEDITQVRFLPSSPNILISSSVDGLICFTDCSNFCEDDALLSSLNVQSSVSKFSLLNAEMLSVLTDDQKLSLWNISDQSLLCQYGSVLSLDESLGLNVNYGLDCHFIGSDLCLSVGNDDGELGLVKLKPDPIETKAWFKYGHTDSVRCLEFIDEVSFI